MFSDSCNITKFLNRILGMEVDIQNSLFGYFTNTLGKIIMDAKKEGKWDLGILGWFLFSIFLCIITIFIISLENY